MCIYIYPVYILGLTKRPTQAQNGLKSFLANWREENTGYAQYTCARANSLVYMYHDLQPIWKGDHGE